MNNKLILEFNKFSNVKKSAGIILYNKDKKVLLFKTGGPLYEGRERPWGISKGHVDKGESLIETAIRELKEESGIIISKENNFIDLDSVYEKEHNKIIYCFALEFNNDFNFNPEYITFNFRGKTYNIPEVEEYKWFDIPTAKNNIRPIQIPFLNRLEKIIK